jgi:hypothetical protein
MTDTTAPQLATRDTLRAVLADHFVMWHDFEDPTPIRGEWRCACGLKFGFSDSAIDHQADALAGVVRDPSTLARVFRTAAELVVQDVRTQRGDHIASLVEDSFAAHFDRAGALTEESR